MVLHLTDEQALVDAVNDYWMPLSCNSDQSRLKLHTDGFIYGFPISTETFNQSGRGLKASEGNGFLTYSLFVSMTAISFLLTVIQPLDTCQSDETMIRQWMQKPFLAALSAAKVKCGHALSNRTQKVNFAVGGRFDTGVAHWTMTASFGAANHCRL